MRLLDRLRGSTVASGLLSAETSHEGDRATTLELFFDLVYAFAFTQVTALMSHGANGITVLEGLVMLGLLWGPWSSFAWLANQTRADRGVGRIGIIAATILMFVAAALVVPATFRAHPGDDAAPAIVFAIAFLLVQSVHLVLYLIAAGGDTGLRRQVVVSVLGAMVPTCLLLLLGAVVGPPFQLWLWLAGFVVLWLMIYLTSNGGDWRIQSSAHFAERHALVVILALGESVVAIGVGAADLPIDATVIAAAVLAIGLGLGLWWNYFHHLSTKIERLVARRTGNDRTMLATQLYTYLHLAVIAGIVVAALGIETTTHDAPEWRAIGWFAACALGGGIGLYLASTGFLWRRASGEWALIRMGGAALAVLLVPALAFLPAVLALAVAFVVVAGVAATEQVLGRHRRSGAATIPARSAP
jgi:low temperature requirement protein LtrA